MQVRTPFRMHALKTRHAEELCSGMVACVARAVYSARERCSVVERERNESGTAFEKLRPDVDIFFPQAFASA